MNASERERHELAARLEELLGADQAATLMEHLPPVPWDALARREDLLALRSDVDELRVDVDGLRTDVDGLGRRVNAVEGELRELRGTVTRTNDRIDHLAQVMELRFDALGDRITAHVAERVDTQTRLLVFSLLAAVLTATAIALGSNAL